MWQKLSNSLRAFFGSSESAQTSLLGCRAKKKYTEMLGGCLWAGVYRECKGKKDDGSRKDALGANR